MLRLWYGDPERFTTSDFNRKFEKENKEGEGIYLSPPSLYEFEKPNTLEIYLDQIRICLRTNRSGKKRLHFGNCTRLGNYFQTFPFDALKRSTKRSIEDYPTVFALGATVHSLARTRPWEQAVGTFREQSFEDYTLSAHEDALRGLGVGGVDYGEMDEYEDRGELVGTIDDD